MNDYCQKCGRFLNDGELRYFLKIQLTSMFDGFIPMSDVDIEDEVARLIEALSHQDPAEAAKDVAQTIEFIICRACRNLLVGEWDVGQKELHH